MSPQPLGWNVIRAKYQRQSATYSQGRLYMLRPRALRGSRARRSHHPHHLASVYDLSLEKTWSAEGGQIMAAPVHMTEKGRRSKCSECGSEFQGSEWPRQGWRKEADDAGVRWLLTEKGLDRPRAPATRVLARGLSLGMLCG